MVRQARLIAVVRTFSIGCALLVVVGCEGVRSEDPEETQGHTQSTKEQAHSDRCEGTRFIFMIGRARYTTNDLPGCPKGGLLSGTDQDDYLAGKKGEDEVRGFGGSDELHGGYGSDVIYGGPGMDFLEGGAVNGYDRSKDVLYGGEGDDMIFGAEGEDVLHGGDGNDYVDGRDEGVKDMQRDELYCGAGRDTYLTGRLDYVDSTCEVTHSIPPGTPKRVRVD